ncbi:hypothetical protein ACHAWF_008604 [Thalassiosira exigua]
MSLSSNHGNGNGGQGRGRGQGPPPQAPMMVQTILESFTRCLYPLEPCAKACAAKTESVVRNRRRANSSSPVNAGQLFFGKRGGGGGGGGSLSAPASRAVSRSSSSSDRRRSRGCGRPNDHVSLDASCDADDVSRAKKEARRRRPRAATTEYTPQDLAERSTKRKLEIFRGTGSDGGGMGRRRPPAPKRTTTTTRGNDDRPRNPHRRHDPPPHGGHPARQSSEPSRPASPLALSDDEEELVRLAHDGGRRGRFACGMNMGRFSPSRRRDSSSPSSSSDRAPGTGGIGGEGPISSVARLFNRGLTEAQKPFGLCFATPVRTASGEDARNLSDDKLTDEEFLRRHCGPEEATPRRPEGEGGAVVTPGGEEGGMSGSPGECGPDRSSYCEEETISSTLYLDAQYSHVVQTRPPMPLFQEQLVAPGEEDGLNEILRRRSAAAAAVQAEEARRSASSHPPSFPVRELHARTSVRRKVSNGSSSGSLGSPRKKSPRKGGSSEEGAGGGARRGFRMEATGTPPRGATGTMEEVPSVRTVSAGSSRSGVGGGGAPPRASPPREGSPKASPKPSPKSSPKNSPKRSPRGFFRLGPRAAEF